MDRSFTLPLARTMKNLVPMLLHLVLTLLCLTGCNRVSNIQNGVLGGIVLSTSTSTISVSAASVISGGSAQVVLTTRDQNGRPFYIPASNPAVVFSAAGGTSTGSFGNVTDNHDGTYAVDFTGVTGGTTTFISASVNGLALTTSVGIRVVPGNFSLANSLVTLSSASVVSGAQVEVTLATYDDSGNPLTSGGLQVSFLRSGGTSTGNFSSVTDHGDGTYSATFTGVRSGTATSISASLNASAVTTAAPTLTVTTGSPIAIMVASGNNQSATIGTALPQALGVTVADLNGNLVPNVTVDWSISGSGGTLSATSETDSTGLAVNSLSLGTVAGVSTVVAEIDGSSTSITFSETTLPGPINHFTLSAIPASATAGTAFGFTLTARDSQNNIKTDYQGTVHFTSTDGNSPSLPSDTTFAGSDHGVKTFSVTFKTSGNQTLTAAQTPGGSPSVTSPVIAVSSNTATQLAIITGPTNTVAASTISAVLVRALDTYGNTATGFNGAVTIAIGTNAGGGTISGTLSKNASSGSVSFSDLSINKTGVGYTLAASAGPGISAATSNVFNITQGTPASIAVVSGNNLSGTVGQSLGTSLVVVVKDANQNVVNGATVDWSSNAGNVTDSSVATLSNGQASNQFTFGHTAGVATVTATIDGTGISTTFSETGIASSTISSVVWKAQPLTSYTASNATAMTNFQAELLDSFGNVITTNNSDQVSLTLTTGTGTLGGTTTQTVVGGIASFTNITYTKAETIVITATESSASQSVSSSSIVVGPNNPSTLHTTISSGSASANADGVTAVSVTVLIKDAYSNPVPGVTVTFASTGTGNVLTQPGSVTDANGLAVGSITSTVAALKTLSITSPSGFTGITTSMQFIASNVVAANSTIVGTGPVVADGLTASTVTVTLEDINSNPVSGIVPSFSATGSGNSYGVCSTTDVNGHATCQLSSTKAETKTLSITGPVSETGGTVTFQNGAASELVWTTEPVGGQAGAAFTTQGVVTIEDAHGNVVVSGADSTATITLSLQSGSGSLSGTLTQAAVNGVADFSSHALSLTAAGTKILKATKSDTTGSGGTGAVSANSSAMTITPLGAATLTLSGFPSSIQAGSGGTLTVTALDTYGNTANGYTGVVHFTSNDPQAVLPSDYTFTSGLGLDNGVHVFSGVTLKSQGASQSITGTDTVTGSITGVVSPITVSPAAAASLRVSAFPTPSTAGSAHSVTITALDQYGNTASGYTGTVHFTTSSALSSLPGNYAFTSGLGLDNGVHTFTGVSLNSAGTNQSITATDTVTNSIAGSETALTVTGSSAVTLGLSGFPTSIQAGSLNSFQVSAFDQYGNLASGYTGTVHFTTTSTLNSLPSDYTFTSGSGLDNGVHTFSGASLNTVGSQSITATDTATNTITATESSIVVTAGQATSLAVTGFPSTVTAGSLNMLTVTAYDTYANVASGYSGVVSFSTTSALKSLPSNYTFTSGSGLDNGAHSFINVSLNTAGTQSITATDTVTNSIAGTESSITVNPYNADHLVKIAGGDGQTATAGTAVATNPQVEVVDQYGNAVSGTSLTFTPSAGGGAVGASPQTSVLGYASTSFTLGTTAGTNTLVVARQTTALPGTPATLTFTETGTAGNPDPSQSTITVASANLLADGVASDQVTITLKDINGNVVPNTTASFASTGSNNSLTQPGTQTNVNGVTTGSFKTTGAGSKTLSIASPIGLTTDTATITASLPSLSIAAASANEGSNLSFTVTLSQASGEAVTVQYATSDGTAVAGANYTSTTGTLTIAAGNTSGTITVPTVDDTVYNVALNMSLSLSSPTNATIATSNATGTINNIDSQPSILINDVTVNEGSSAVFTVSLSNKSYQSISVSYVTANGTATSGVNYTLASGTATIAAGGTSTTVTIATLDDGIYEAGALTFNVNLTSPTNATIADNVGVGSITNTDGMPSVQFTTSTQSVNQSPSTQSVTITAQVSAPTGPGTVISVPIATSGSATSGTSYNLSAATITIAAGASSGSTTLTAVNSAAPGPDTSAILTIGTPTNATVGTTNVDTVTIVNNNYPSVNFSVASQDVAINQATATVTVTLSAQPSKTVTVPITVLNTSTGVAGTDYTLTAPTLSFASGVTSQSFTFTVLDQLSPATANATLVLGLGSLTNGFAGTTTSQTSTIRSPSLDLNFAAMYNPSVQMSQAPYNQITFIRGSTASYMDCDGVIKTAAVNVPRIDCGYNGTNWQPNGLLIEEARTNSLTYSSSLTNAAWLATRASVSVGPTAPDGTIAQKLVEDSTASATHSVSSTVSITANSTYTASFYVKPAGRTAGRLFLSNTAGSNGLQASFDLSAVTAVAANVGSGTNATATIASVGNGWYRVSVSGIIDTTDTQATTTLYLSNGSTVYTGNGTSGLTAWGAQLELGGFPTSYIPTTAAAATRSADNAKLASLGGWFNNASNSLYTQFYTNALNQGNAGAFEVYQSDDVGSSVMYNTSNIVYGLTRGAGGISANSYTSSSAPYYAALAYDSTGMILSVNGNKQSNSTTETFTPTYIQLGNQRIIGTPNYLNGPIGRFTYYSEKLPALALGNITGTSDFRTYAPYANLTLTTQTVIEPQGTVYVTAALSEPATTAITVPYTVGGTAISGTNYSGLASGSFSFSTGSSRSTISFSLLDDGGSSNPTILISLGSGTGYNLGGNTTQTITIERPTLDLNFGSMISPTASTLSAAGITFTRASTASYVDATGLISYAAVNAPRIDYDPTTHQPNGILIEESRINSLLQSQNFSTNWTLQGSTVTANATLAPDGTSTANLVTESAASSNHQMYQSQSLNSGTTYTASVYIKAAQRTAVQITASSGYFSSGHASIGLCDTVAGVNTLVFGAGSTGITSLQSAWYRCSLTFTPTISASGSINIYIYGNEGTTTTSYVGDGVSGLYLWGAQLEAGAFPTSYIPTTTAAVTRSMDVAQSASIGGWYNTSGSVLLQSDVEAASTAVLPAYTFDNGGGSNSFGAVRSSGSSGVSAFFEANGGTYTFQYAPSVWSSLSAHSAAASYQTGNQASADMGGQVVAGNSAIPTVNTLRIGGGGGGAGSLDGWVNRFTYYPVVLSNQQLQILSNPNQYSPRMPTPSVTLRAASQSILQSDGQAFFVAVLSQPAMSTITVPYTISGTAVSGTDYSGLASGTLTFNSGSSVATTQFTVLATSSSGKTVVMTLGAPTGATLGTNSSETIYLTNSTTGLTLATSSYTTNAAGLATYSGTCGPGMTITVTGSQSATITCSNSGTWSWTPTLASDGSYTYTFTETDGIGSGTSVTGTYDYDTTAPGAAPSLTDGNYTTNLTTAPTFTWTAATDSGTGASGISYYQIGITTASGTPPSTWTAVGNVLTYQLTSLSLTDGVMYYGAVQAVDKAGNSSAVTYGDGFSVVTDTPTLGLNFMNAMTIGSGTATTNTNSSYPAMVQFSNAAGSGIAAPMYYNSTGLLTAAHENLLTYGQSFSNAAWTLSGLNAFGSGSVQNTTNVTAPDGTMTAALIEEDTSTGYHKIYQSITKAASAITYTYSVYAMSGTNGRLELQVDDGGGDIVNFDGNLQTGNVGSCNVGGNYTCVGVTSTAAGGGWWRFAVTFTTNTGTSLYLRTYIQNSSLQTNFTGDGSSGIYIWGAQLEQGTGPSSYIYTASTPAYGPRFDYNPSTLALNGLLIEESRQNMLTYSQNFSNAAWTDPLSYLTVTANSGGTASPDGTNDSSLVAETTANNYHSIGQGITGYTAGTNVCFSVFTKKYGAEASISLQIQDNTAYTNGIYTVFSLSTGAASGTGAFGNASAPTATSQALPNGWYRFVLCGIPTTSYTTLDAIVLLGGGNSYTGVTTNGVYLWGGQLEQGAMVTSYIPTASTTMSRSFDKVIIQANASSWFSASAGTIVSSALFPTSLTSANGYRVFNLDDGTINNEVAVFLATTSAIEETLKVGNSTQFNPSRAFTLGTPTIVAAAYLSNSAAFATAGLISTTTSAGVPTGISELCIGSATGTGYFTNGWIQSLNYYNSRLTNSAVQELTHP